ncbi:MAG: glycosyltransferase family 39 protein [Hyphomicrobiaceae bacterium]|nr:glycosyltransferase family 39 protein [Hyphomicrobiaceae bacterium]
MRRSVAMAAPGLARPAAAPLIWAALAALLALRLLALAFNGTDLFFDEAQYWTWAQEPAFGYYSKPPLIAALIGATTSLCGDSSFCVRLSAPLMHTATAGILFLIGRRLYDEETGLWAALTFATLPGVSLSAGIVSTDVPLLFGWALAVLGLVGLLQERRGWMPALALGVGLGLGLNAKYAMAFLPASLAIYLLVTPSARALLRDPRLWLGMGLGLAMIVPNLAWNAANKFATFAHTADNAKWTGSLIHPGKGLEFIGAQLAVFGPILLAGLALICRRAWVEGARPSDRLLLCLTLPVLAAITAQAFVSRAHANWAATAYVAGSVLVPAVLLRLGLSRWLRASLGLHLAVMAVLMAGTAAAGRFIVPLAGDPFQRTLGWSELGERTARVVAEARAAGRPVLAVMTDDRAVTASLLYYLRHEKTPIVAWRDGPRPLDHYEMSRPFAGARQTPLLLVATRRDSDRITGRFGSAATVREEAVPAGLGTPRHVRFIVLDGYRPN